MQDNNPLLCHDCDAVRATWMRPDDSKGDFERVRLLKKMQGDKRQDDGIEPQIEITFVNDVS